MKKLSFFIAFICISIFSNAQIGYQVSLLNTATGEPRANERVTAKVEITDSKNNVIFSDNMDGLTNDFGVLSLTIGNSQTFADVNMVNYPFYISVTVGGVLIGKTQILSVPFANSLVPVNVVGTWRMPYSSTGEYPGCYYEYVFYDNGTYIFTEIEPDFHYDQDHNLIGWSPHLDGQESGVYEVDGKNIYTYDPYGWINEYRYYKNQLRCGAACYSKIQ